MRVNTDELDRGGVLTLANSILEYRFVLGLNAPQITAEGNIAWHSNPTTDREWLYALNRHGWWPILGLAYVQTGDERYAAAFVSQMLDWVKESPPPPRQDEKSPSWRLMEVGMRMRVSWIPCFGMFYHSPAFTAEAKLTMLRSIYDHAQFLTHFKTNRNHLLRESNGLAYIGTYFPEFKEAIHWRQVAFGRLDEELRKQVNRDGSHIEVSTGYQSLVIDEFQNTYDLLRAHHLSLPKEDLGSWLESMYHMMAYIVRPDGTFPQVNDGSIYWGCSQLAQAGETFGRDDLVYIGTGGSRGTRPADTSVSFDRAGLYVMRSDWGQPPLSLPCEQRGAPPSVPLASRGKGPPPSPPGEGRPPLGPPREQGGGPPSVPPASRGEGPPSVPLASRGKGPPPSPPGEGRPPLGPPREQGGRGAGAPSDARYLLFDAGPYGGPHGHEDKLSIELYAFGQAFIVDAGTYTYNKRDPFRTYFVSSHAHNTVLVDGKSQVRRWKKENLNPQTSPGNADGNHPYAAWISQPDFDYVAASYSDGYGPFSFERPQNVEVIEDVVHTRRILFVKPDYWVIVDELQAPTPHRYCTLFHTVPEMTPRRGPGNRAILRTAPDAPALYLIPATPPPYVEGEACPEMRWVKGSKDPIQGWYSPRSRRKAPAGVVIYEWAAELPFTEEGAAELPFTGEGAAELPFTGEGAAELPSCQRDAGGPSPIGEEAAEAGGSLSAATLLYPRPRDEGGNEIDIKHLAVSEGEGLAFVVTTDRGSDYLLFSHDEGLKQFGAYQSRGIVAGVRTDRDGDVVSQFEGHMDDAHPTSQGKGTR